MILVVDKTKKVASNLADMFFYMGFLSRGVTPTEALSEISTLYRAVVITSPHALPDAREFTERLKTYATRIPIFAIVEREGERGSDTFDATISKGLFAPKIAEKIIEYCDRCSLPIPGHYSMAGIDISADLKTPTYFQDALPFTKTESMILRYLIRAYPNPSSAEEILDYSYRPAKRPDVANIRTHISIINKKFKSIAGEYLISPTFGEGYSIIGHKETAGAL